MAIRIGFNMWPFSSTRAGGSYYYAASLLREFAQICPDDMLVLYGKHGRDLIPKTDGFREVRSIELQDFQQILASRSQFDVLFTPGAWRWFNMPDFPTVNYIPDIQEYYYPEFFSRLELFDRYYYRPYLVQASTFTITVSNYSKENIVEKLEADEDRIRVVYHGCEPIFHDISNSGTKPGSLPDDIGPYLFYPANSWKHKNHLRLLDALVIAKQHYGQAISCFFTGHLFNGEFNNVNIPLEIAKRNLQSHVRHIGRVNLSQLKYLYSHAVALILPSLFEGFGIPIVEAMTCGCPIIASDRTSIPEIAGEAALYFDPDNPDDIAQKIVQFFQNGHAVSERVKPGKIRAQNFSYQRQAAEHLSVLEEAFESHNSKLRNKKPVAKNENSSQHSLGIIFVLNPFCGDKTAARIAKFQHDFDNLVESVVLIKGGALSQLQHKLEKATRVVVAADFHSGMQQALGLLSSNLVMLSNGKVFPLKHFVQQVAAAALDFDKSIQLFHGDSYYRDLNTERVVTDVIPSGTQNDDRRLYCVKNLCFMVRKDSLQELLSLTPRPIKSLKQVADTAWDNLVRQRVYQVFSVRIFFTPLWINLSPRVLVVRFIEYCGTQSLIGKILRLEAARSLLGAAISMYTRLPVRSQLTVQAFYKILAARKSRITE